MIAKIQSKIFLLVYKILKSLHKTVFTHFHKHFILEIKWISADSHAERSSASLVFLMNVGSNDLKVLFDQSWHML